MLGGRRDGIFVVREPKKLDYAIHVQVQQLCKEQQGLLSSQVLQDVLLQSSTVLAFVVVGFTLRFLRKLFPFFASPVVMQRVEPELIELPRSSPTARSEPTPDLERTGECLICLEQMTQTAVGSCAHHFCVGEACLRSKRHACCCASLDDSDLPRIAAAGCLLECCRLTPRCPRCQIPITAVHLDTEFDQLLKLARAGDPTTSSSHDDKPNLPNRHVVRLRLPKGARAGITLKTCRWRFGVAVSAASEEKMAFRCGLRVGDVIVSMNGVPCRTHQQSIEIINR